jgi:hypothetical protein
MVKIKCKYNIKTYFPRGELKVEFELTPPPMKDERFMKFREWIFRAVNWKWNANPRWGGAEAKNLSSLLAEMPELTEREFCLALKNLLNSDDVPAMQRPAYWLPKIESYIIHAHNTFGRNPDAAITTAQTQRARRNSAAIEQAIQNRRIAPNSSRDLPAEGIDQRGSRTLGSGLKRLCD